MYVCVTGSDLSPRYAATHQPCCIQRGGLPPISQRGWRIVLTLSQVDSNANVRKLVPKEVQRPSHKGWQHCRGKRGNVLRLPGIAKLWASFSLGLTIVGINDVKRAKNLRPQGLGF